MTANVETKYDKADGIHRREPSRIANGDAERTPFSGQLIVLFGIDLLFHPMDVSAPDAWVQAV